MSVQIGTRIWNIKKYKAGYLIDKLNNDYSIDPFYLKLQNKIERRKEGYAKINFYPQKKAIPISDTIPSQFPLQKQKEKRYESKEGMIQDVICPVTDHLRVTSSPQSWAT